MRIMLFHETVDLYGIQRTYTFEDGLEVKFTMDKTGVWVKGEAGPIYSEEVYRIAATTGRSLERTRRLLND